MQHHPVNLCQPDACKSCGACCGLYNWQDHSRPALASLLELQTGLFFSLQNFDDLDAYRRQRDARITGTTLFDTIYNCEFLGFIDSEHRRVGCLLHPEVTGKKELRDHCFYGSKVCSEHFCPGFSCLTTTEQLAVVRSVDDWYLYGLVITDIDLVKEFFRHVETTLGDSIKDRRLENPGIRKALQDFFRLKQDWMFRSRENRLGKYYFSEAEYHIARIEYEKSWGIPPSRFDKILVSLESEFAAEDDLHAAEAVITDRIERFLKAYDAS